MKRDSRRGRDFRGEVGGEDISRIQLLFALVKDGCGLLAGKVFLL